MIKTQPVAPFDVGTLILTSLEGLLGAAALHLGEAFPDGRTLEASRQDPDEAWRALLAASGIIANVGPLMGEDVHETLLGRLDELAGRIADLHPDREFPVPELALAGEELEDD